MAHNKAKMRPVVPAAAVGIVASAAAMGILMPSMQRAAQSKPAADKKPAVKASKATAASVTVKSEEKPAAASASGGRRDLSFYTGDLRANMFSEPVAPAPKDPPAPKPVPPAPVDPLADWSFTGSAKIGNDSYAIVENVTTHDSVMVKAGDDFEGYKVDSVDPKFLALVLGKEPKMMMVSMNTGFTPLSKSAAFLSASPAVQQAGAQGAAMQGMMMGANGQMINFSMGDMSAMGGNANGGTGRRRGGFGNGGGFGGFGGGNNGGGFGGFGGGGGGFGGGGFGGGRRGGFGGGG